jgi:hypothetical protein
MIHANRQIRYLVTHEKIVAHWRISLSFYEIAQDCIVKPVHQSIKSDCENPCQNFIIFQPLRSILSFLAILTTLLLRRLKSDFVTALLRTKSFSSYLYINFSKGKRAKGKSVTLS